ncbi:hypothetical protein SGPA1_41140 [Streptomyces misionensis JCM 4497]
MPLQRQAERAALPAEPHRLGPAGRAQSAAARMAGAHLGGGSARRGEPVDRLGRPRRQTARRPLSVPPAARDPLPGTAYDAAVTAVLAPGGTPASGS